MRRFLSSLFPLLGLPLLASGCSDNGLSILNPGDDSIEAPRIEVYPTTLDFGAMVTTGISGYQEVLVTNVGNATLDIISVQPESPTPYDVEGPLDLALSPGEFTLFQVYFDPEAEGSLTGRVHVRSSDLESPDVPVELLGEGIVPRISLTPAWYDFEIVEIGASESQLLTLANVGSADLTVSALQLSSATGEFILDPLDAQNGALPWVLPPGEDREVLVSYFPIDATADSALVQVGSDDPTVPLATAEFLGMGPSFEGFSTGWYVYDDGVAYETTSSGAHVVDHHGDYDLYWYEPSGAHGLIDSANPTADFAVMRDYVLAHAGAPTEPSGPFNYDGDSTLATFEYATYTYFLCDFYLDPADDPTLYSIAAGYVDDGIQVMVNGQILGRKSLGEASPASWPLSAAVPGAVNSLIIILVDDSAVDKYVQDLAFYRSGVMVLG